VTSTLEASDLSKSYRGRRVVADVTLNLTQGEVVGLLGPNGAGKTTTFYILVGLTSPDAGAVRIDDADITRMPMYQRARAGISYLPQEPSVFRKLTVEDNLRVVSETLDLEAPEQDAIVTRLLEEFGIDHLRAQRAYTLSGGERRRLEIARALVLTPKFILLDEPFAGIDPLAVLDIQRIIAGLRARNIGVLITDHNVRETLNITDRAYIINAGKILRGGPPHDLARDLEVKKVYLGENFRLN
jgi:lipopolysaccharide export system ATP-binding protein